MRDAISGFVCALGLCAGAQAENIAADLIAIAAPQSAVQTQGAPLTNWLNVVNAPVTVNQAFSAFNIVDDGFANVSAGTEIEVTFAPGHLVNARGPDLVLVEAGFDQTDVYLISTGHDSFDSHRLVTPTKDTAYYQVFYVAGGGQLFFQIFAAAIDLSDFGVPFGASVERVRFFAEGPGCDPLGVGVLLPLCPTDLDLDGTTAQPDLGVFLAAYGSGIGDAAWNPHADFDGNGVIDQVDLGVLLAAFGQACDD